MSSNQSSFLSVDGGSSGNDDLRPISQNPTATLGLEFSAQEEWWSFVPTYYPERFTQTKDRELDRSGRSCAGENVSVKTLKNREFHATGIILANEIPVFQKLLDFDGKIDVISPLTPSGGMECRISSAELGDHQGFDPIEREHRFEYTIDLVSTGRDEYDDGNNSIVSAIVGEESNTEYDPPDSYSGT